MTSLPTFPATVYFGLDGDTRASRVKKTLNMTGCAGAASALAAVSETWPPASVHEGVLTVLSLMFLISLLIVIRNSTSVTNQ